MPLEKCCRSNCRPIQTERSYQTGDKFSIWCMSAGCYRNAVGATQERAAEEWEKLVRGKPAGPGVQGEEDLFASLFLD